MPYYKEGTGRIRPSATASAFPVLALRALRLRRRWLLTFGQAQALDDPAGARIEPVADGGPAEPGLADPGAAAHHAPGAIGLRKGRVILVMLMIHMRKAVCQ
ncbi:MAG: hypothetical protein EXS36_13035 [Pedosphaera sp.]|nr:hypothetical protein [Pedosphaera sp.]